MNILTNLVPFPHICISKKLTILELFPFLSLMKNQEHVRFGVGGIYCPPWIKLFIQIFPQDK